MIRFLSAVFFIFALPLASHSIAQERHLRDYTLRHALPEQVVPVLAAQLSPGSSVTPYYQQLILNVTDAEYRTLQTLLEQLDKAPRSLLISVRKRSDQYSSADSVGVRGRIGDGAVQVQNGSDWQQRDGARATIDSGTSRNSGDNSQRVRAVEGMEAFISTGNTVSMRSGVYGASELVPAQSGFYATARVVGDEVIVDIDQRDDRVQRRDIATQHLQTQIRGSIGEWIPLGGINTARSGSERGAANYAGDTSSATADLAIKVELIAQ